MVAGVFVIIALITGLTITSEDNVYYCESTGLVGECFKLSAINSAGFQTRCYYNSSMPTRYKNCRFGWEVFTQEETIVPPDLAVQEQCFSYGCFPI